MKYKEILQIRGKRAALNTILVNLYAALYTAKKEEDQEIQEIECGVQALIRECGADKLSAVDPSRYADLKAKAEVL